MHLNFKPHPYINGLELAKYRGFSVLTGSQAKALLGAYYEVQYDGEVHKFNKLVDVHAFIRRERRR